MTVECSSAVLEAMEKNAKKIEDQPIERVQISEESSRRSTNSDFDSLLQKKANSGLAGYWAGSQAGMNRQAAGSHSTTTTATGAVIPDRLPVGREGSTTGGIEAQVIAGQASQGQSCGARMQVAPGVGGEQGPCRVGQPGCCEQKYAEQLVLEEVCRPKTEVVMIPAAQVGPIIGRHGATIRWLSDCSGCELYVVQRGGWQAAREMPLQITGEENNRLTAKWLLNDLFGLELKEPVRGSTDLDDDDEEGLGTDDVRREHCLVPTSKCGKVVGTNGSSLHFLMSYTGAHIAVGTDPPPSPSQMVVVLEGTPSQITAAKDAIFAKLDPAQQYQQYKMYHRLQKQRQRQEQRLRSSHRPAYRNQQQQQQQASFTHNNNNVRRNQQSSRTSMWYGGDQQMFSSGLDSSDQPSAEDFPGAAREFPTHHRYGQVRYSNPATYYHHPDPFQLNLYPLQSHWMSHLQGGPMVGDCHHQQQQPVWSYLEGLFPGWTADSSPQWTDPCGPLLPPPLDTPSHPLQFRSLYQPL